MNLFGKPEPAPALPDFSFTSTVGIRANWTCVACAASATTHQVAHVSTVRGINAPITKLDPPENWTVVDNATYCPIHTLRKAAP